MEVLNNAILPKPYHMQNKDLESLDLRINNLKKWLSEDLDISTTLKFLASLKIGLSLILPSNFLGNQKFQWNSKDHRKINRENLSLLLGQNKFHMKEAIKKAKYDSSYILSLNFINKMDSSIRIKLRSLNVPTYIINIFGDKIFNDYIREYNPPYSNRIKNKKFHPYLKEDYFAIINSIEKAYWLGLLWADGWISKKVRSKNGNPNFIVGLKQSEHHKEIVENYCNAIGFNQLYLKKYRNKEFKTWFYQAKFMNNKFAFYLIQLGFIVGKKKSLNIELPLLRSTLKVDARSLYLGFLLGYYDGDGTRCRTYITSGSIKFINQIQVMFNLNNKIIENHYQKKDGTQGKTYKLALGRDLMCEMLNNFQKSYKPKRNAIAPQLKKSYEKLINKRSECR